MTTTITEFEYKITQLKRLYWALVRIIKRWVGMVPPRHDLTSKHNYEKTWARKAGNEEFNYGLKVRFYDKPMYLRQADIRKERVAWISEEVSGYESVLELGCGWGINLLSLAVLNPELKYLRGVEFSDEGVRQFYNYLENPPYKLLQHVTGKSKEEIDAALKAATFGVTQGDMTTWREDKKYDVVFSNAAIEQIPVKYPLAFKTAATHATYKCIFVEEFREVQNTLQKVMLYAKDLFRSPVSVVEDAGLSVVRYDKWCIEKIAHSWGFVVAKPVD